MALFSRIKTWVSGETLFASDLNGEFDNLLNNTAPASIEDFSTNTAQMQSTADPGGVGSESLATSLAGEIQRLRFVLKRILNEAQWYVAPTTTLSAGGIVTNSFADGAITEPKLATDAVSTIKIAALAITNPKIANDTIALTKNAIKTTALSATAGNIAISGSSGTVLSGATTQVPVVSCTLVTTGRPVRVTVTPSGVAGQTSEYQIAANGVGFIFIYRDAVEIHQQRINAPPGSAAVLPVFSEMLDFPVAGTYTYELRLQNQTANAAVINVRIQAYEI